MNPTNVATIETTLRESMLYEAGVLAGEIRVTEAAAVRLAALAGELGSVDFEPFRQSLGALAGFLVNEVAPKVKGEKLRSALLNGVQALPANGKGVVDFTREAARKVSELANEFRVAQGDKSGAFAKQLAEIGELAPARPRPERRRRLLVRIAKRVLERVL